MKSLQALNGGVVWPYLFQLDLIETALQNVALKRTICFRLVYNKCLMVDNLNRSLKHAKINVVSELWKC